MQKRYGKQMAVDDVSLDVPRGKFLTLLGPSGSGKTTVLMAIAGFVSPTSGDIFLDDRAITRLAPEKRNFGMVFQGYALFPQMTVTENVWFPLRVRGISRSAAQPAIKSTLELVQMSHLADRTPSELSGGQQQRVALARALVFEPNLLLLDEPLSALDKALRSDLQWELKALHRRLGSTFINVTHDQEEALSMSDEIVILRDGRVEQAGEPAQLYSRPGTRFVASFLGDSNFVRGLVTAKEKDRFRYRVKDRTLVQAGAPEPASPDGHLLVALRPENIAVSTEEPARANTVQGTISDFKYIGSSYFLQISTPELGPMMVKMNAWQPGLHPSIGTPVWLGWDPDAAVPVLEN
ncbi:ABC transporter ATP-binding protein [Rhodoligotrophos ferricapiens]|uniref:ABC transporter ATP-binding protein n=1 Tax=Rhodoligotrophos ferricapiens TaxID=3069264 RepID=UPI00315CE2D7